MLRIALPLLAFLLSAAAHADDPEEHPAPPARMETDDRPTAWARWLARSKGRVARSCHMGWGGSA